MNDLTLTGLIGDLNIEKNPCDCLVGQAWLTCTKPSFLFFIFFCNYLVYMKSLSTTTLQPQTIKSKLIKHTNRKNKKIKNAAINKISANSSVNSFQVGSA